VGWDTWERLRLFLVAVAVAATVYLWAWSGVKGIDLLFGTLVALVILAYLSMADGR
jgi:hypothetical protein